MKNQKGQALVTLLFFMIIGVTLLTAASLVTLGNVASTSSAEQGTVAYYNAETGIEDALLQILRNPPGSTNPYNGATVMFGSIPVSKVVVTVAPSTTTLPPPTSLTITAAGTYASAMRKVQVVETNGATGWQVTSWQEIN